VIKLTQFLAAGSIALVSTISPSYAMLPDCASASSDSDGDGYGWENNNSCRVVASISRGNALGLPGCQMSNSDSDGDGYGWENNASCLVGGPVDAVDPSSRFAPCVGSDSDSDGDGYGWENNSTCLVSASVGIISDDAGSATSNGISDDAGSATSNGISDDAGSATSNGISDDAGSATSNGISDDAGSATSNGISDDAGSATSNGISDDAGSATSNGISDDAGSATSNGISDDAGSATSNGIGDDAGSATSNGALTDNSNASSVNDGTGGSSNNGGSFTSGTGGAIIRSSTPPIIAATSSSVSSEGGDLFATTQVGDFLLMQNAWRAWRAAPGYNWNQSVFANRNGAPISFSYDWGPGTPGINGRASDDFYVRAYPELIYGIKDEFRTSATKAEIGLPVRVDELPFIEIDYAFDGPQFGTPRTVDASVNPRFPNGTTISGERNVAVESFLYTGDCDDSLNVNRSNGSNHAYEVMVWLDSGAERLPAASADYVTTVSLSGASYNVYTKTSDERYIAFVAVNPETKGSIVWNDFIDWARNNAHLVEQNFGARANSVQIQDSWCVANIIIGTEIFWGAGNFDLYDWTITQRQ